ncbi:uncharacterized mitochondrial protein AtMg00310-like [Lotus japonicus]|uniref:uncharacterized mitochondrial protein AtMg00310-like n=1 Tax=Lotus japonicus TaxID=34305 RepID=UPI00258E6128|nr:uncharacterized mitochondrial protein AtMg00310-like [Lotus japonicus]
MRSKLTSWNSRFLSQSGRLVLLRDAISSIPVYYMSVFKALVGVVGEFEKLMRSFLWGSDQGRKRISWVAWEQICKSQQLGGLGLGFLGWKNKALLLKWAWRFGKEKEAFWRKVVCSKYGWNENALVLHLTVDGFSNCSLLILDLLKNLLADEIMAKAFRESLLCKLGSGKHIRFWLDPWEESVPLRIMFPRLFAIASNRNVVIRDIGSFIGRKWLWAVEFKRPCFGWELEEKTRLFQFINVVLPSQGEDSIFVAW